MRSGATLAGAGPTDQTREPGSAREGARWSALVLAGKRAEPDPLSHSFGVPLKALIPVAGEAMVAHVVRTLADCPSIGPILIVTQEPEALDELQQAQGIAVAAGRDGIATSVALHAGSEAAPWPVLVTTADHPLLTVEMVEHFLAASRGWDATIGVVERGVLVARYPASRRTWLRFRGGAFTGANLFALRSLRVSEGLRVLAKAERDRKHQLKLLWRFGPMLAAGALLRTLSLKQAVAIGGRRLGIAAAAIALPFAEAGIDVDRIEDHRTAARILADRAGKAENGDAPVKPEIDESMLPRRSLIYRLGKRARPLFDRAIARSSLIGTGPIIDQSELPWTAEIRREWRTIRAEADSLIAGLGEIPPLRVMSPDHSRIAQHDLWKAFFLYGYGYKVERNCARCPATTAIVERIPDLNSAFFSILLPGTRIESHVGPTKGLVTCHLGLMVPPNGGCTMRIHDREVGWAEGECLVFDDTYRHEVTHQGDSPRVVLLIQVKRPLRAPGKQIAALFLAGIRNSPFVQEARRNMGKWEQAMHAADDPAGP